MKPVLFAAVLLADLVIGRAAKAQESWTCTYAGYPNGTPTIIRLHVEGQQLVEVGRSANSKEVKITYTILENNNNGIVAAFGTANDYSNLIPGVGAYVIAIDKKSLAFLLSHTYVSDDNNSSVAGKCMSD